VTDSDVARTGDITCVITGVQYRRGSTLYQEVDGSSDINNDQGLYLRTLLL